MRYYQIILILSLSLLLSCKSDNYSSVFNFDVVTVEDSLKSIPLYGEELKFTGDSFSMFHDIIAYDSLLLSYQMGNATDFYYKVYNLNTKELLGEFCYKGRSLKEFLGIAPFRQLLIENDSLKAYVHDAIGQKTLIWNIAESVEQNKTIIDSLIPNQGKGGIAPYTYVFYLPNDRYIAHAAPVQYRIIRNKPLPNYQLRSITDNHEIHDYYLYTHLIKDGNHPTLYFLSEDAIKLDGSKVAMAMSFFPQINIINTNTDDVKGFRLDNADMFDPNELTSNFRSIDADNDYIYALYRSEDIYPIYKFDESVESVLYQFDWDGNLVQKYVFEQEPITEISIDRSSKSKSLYGVDRTRDEERIYKYTLSH